MIIKRWWHDIANETPFFRSPDTAYLVRKAISDLSNIHWKDFKIKALAWSRGFSDSYPGTYHLSGNLGSVRILSDSLVYEPYQPACPVAPSNKRKHAEISTSSDEDSAV